MPTFTPQNPIVSGSTSPQAITFTITWSSSPSSITWGVAWDRNVLEVSTSESEDNLSYTVRYNFAATAPANGTGMIEVVATDTDGLATGFIYVLPSGWTEGNITLIDDGNGNTYAVQNVASKDPTPMAIGLGRRPNPPPDPFAVASKAANGEAIEWTTLLTSIACYVLLQGRFPPIGNPAAGSGTASGASIDLRMLRKPL